MQLHLICAVMIMHELHLLCTVGIKLMQLHLIYNCKIHGAAFVINCDSHLKIQISSKQYLYCPQTKIRLKN